MNVRTVDHSAHVHRGTALADASPARMRVVLAGNPNVGKSVVFNYLSGMYVDVSNFPGTTVEVSKAACRGFDLYDTPGIYGVSSFNDEERVARDIILNADVVLNVVDAVHLERDLFLTQQLIDMGKKVAVVVNMLDEAKARHISVDLTGLERAFGVPVAGTTATKGVGLAALPDLVAQAREGRQETALHISLHALLAVVGSQAEALLVSEGDAVVADRHGIAPADARARDEVYIDRRNRVNAIVDACVASVSGGTAVSSRLGRLAVHPVFGVVFLLVVLAAMYEFVGDFVAQGVVGYTESEIGHRVVEFEIKALVSRNAATTITATPAAEGPSTPRPRIWRFPEGTSAAPDAWQAARDFGRGRAVDYTFEFSNPILVVFFGEFGAITMTLTYLLFLLLPLVAAFYLSLAVFEDSGYLPRLATLVDRMLHRIGLNGRAVIPIILGFGCVTMATITTRLLGTQREKTIATTILQLAIPCSAQLGVIAALLATAGPSATAIYVAVVLGFLVATGSVLNRLVPGETSPLLLDLPPMRLPQAKNVLQKTWVKTYFFMREATPWFFIGAFAVSVLQVTGALMWIQDALAPLVVTWLKLPREAATAFVMGLVRRDFGAAGLYSMNLSAMQIVAALVTITLFVPCIASLMVMLKERGMKEGLLVWTGSLVLAIGVGGLVAQIIVR